MRVKLWLFGTHYKLHHTRFSCRQVQSGFSCLMSLNGFAGVVAQRRMVGDKKGPIVAHQKPGPLQKKFDLPPAEVVEHNYSYTLEISLLYHG